MDLAIIIMVWPGWMLPLRFTIGSQVVGRLEESHLWSSVSVVEPERESTLLAEVPQLLREIECRPPNEDTQFLFDSLMEEVALNVVDPPVDAAALDAIYGVGQWDQHIVSATPRRVARNAALTMLHVVDRIG